MAGERRSWLLSEGVRRLVLIGSALWLLLWTSVFVSTTVRISGLNHRLEQEIAVANHPAVPEDAEIAQQALALLQSQIDSDRPWQFVAVFIGLGAPLASVAGLLATRWVMQGFKQDLKPGDPPPEQPMPRDLKYRPDFRETRAVPPRPLRR